MIKMGHKSTLAEILSNKALLCFNELKSQGERIN